MSNHEHQESAHKPLQRKEMSRRQFLSYTLGGTTAFMMGGAVLPMVRFAVDPLLEKKTEGTFVKVVEESKITTDPQEFKFQIHQVDGWYVSDPELSAWVSKDANNKIFALSPICKHLGCTIAWNAKGKDEYDCPCHDARYTKDGKNITVAPNPLDEYEVKIENGFVYLGPVKPNSRVG
ncbi:menaquinol-cytochrome c reductase iron-sulfur subunit [Paenibacillus algorifonticola]|uniref:Menaquinol:cytochrome c reductase iron-sulfur subunit n=1 Tax=Paenibacillus algorifonticola TaxID=684063 RepID=A0A1I2EEA4_9BACL|nr:ubiquinol-cytochrome c reductase iron-sulfur subunit [Paenibacillus algorifonticola]SFE90798.1 menaquinol-cytochrome c reductase iron-sulfur subunit [Paenibacillus algorifonticola]